MDEQKVTIQNGMYKGMEGVITKTIKFPMTYYTVKVLGIEHSYDYLEEELSFH